MKFKVIILLSIFLLMTSTISFAAPEDLSSLNEAIKSNTNINSILSGKSKAVLNAMSKSFFDIIRYFVIAGIVIKMMWMYLDFPSAGDDTQIALKMKNKVLWYTLGFLFSINFWSIYIFITRMFSRLNFLY